MSSTSEEDIWDLDQDDISSERAIAAQSLRKLENEFNNAGYKYGVDASKTDHMQEGFDQGLELGMQRGRALGALLGALVSQRELCKKLELPAENVDKLVTRIRAMNHKGAIKEAYSQTVDIAKGASEPTEKYLILAKEAEEAIQRLDAVISSKK
ncbi:hypothetical protein LPJ66_008204 [Kickxella alabastrina]|uniref:Uncharacterized protein n=1 Tax=Kickxella alabastrina TaxID=61397 RepID=A0ACC1I6Q1_9FUNG|nr:hypothetical protein LPJ66_008204 [Kickxella alabastrina]